MGLGLNYKFFDAILTLVSFIWTKQFRKIATFSSSFSTRPGGCRLGWQFYSALEALHYSLATSAAGEVSSLHTNFYRRREGGIQGGE